MTILSDVISAFILGGTLRVDTEPADLQYMVGRARRRGAGKAASAHHAVVSRPLLHHRPLRLEQPARVDFRCQSGKQALQ